MFGSFLGFVWCFECQGVMVSWWFDFVGFAWVFVSPVVVVVVVSWLLIIWWLLSRGCLILLLDLCGVCVPRGCCSMVV